MAGALRGVREAVALIKYMKTRDKPFLANYVQGAIAVNGRAHIVQRDLARIRLSGGCMWAEEPGSGQGGQYGTHRGSVI